MTAATRVELPPVEGLLVITGWHGSTAYRVAVVGTTPHRFRVRALQRLRLPRRGRYLEVGEEALVPKSAVRVTGPALPREAGTAPPRSPRGGGR